MPRVAATSRFFVVLLLVALHPRVRAVALSLHSQRLDAARMARSITARMAHMDAPPKLPPMSVSHGGGGGDDGLILETIAPSQRRATLSLWLWQQEGSSAVTEVADSTIRSMIKWHRDEKSEGGFQLLQRLRGRSLLARVDDEALAIILLHYTPDTSSLLGLLQGKHKMVVDATMLSPTVATAPCAITVDAGIKQAITQLAACHSMRVEFCHTPCHTLDTD